MKATLISLFSLFCLSACVTTHDYYERSRITKVNDLECDQKADRIYLFFEGEPIDYTYERIGLVEAHGEQFTSDDLVMDYLKYEAWNACANAIINIKRDFKTKEKGLLSDDEDDPNLYDATVFSGLAVRIHTDPAFVDKYGEGLDTSFRQSVAEDINQQVKTMNIVTTTTVLASVLGVILTILMLGSMGNM